MTKNWWLISDHPNFFQYRQNLIDTELLDYYHVKHLYRVKKYAPQKPPEVDHACPSITCLLNGARLCLFNGEWAVLVHPVFASIEGLCRMWSTEGTQVVRSQPLIQAITFTIYNDYTYLNFLKTVLPLLIMSFLPKDKCQSQLTP